MKLLISYASNSGGTHLSAKRIRDTIQKTIPNIEIDLIKARDYDAENIEQYDVILLGSNSWLVYEKEGQPHEDMQELMEKIKTHDVSQKTFGVFGCGDSSYLNFCGAVNILEDFIKELEGELLTESLRIDGYFFSEEENEEKVENWAKNFAEKLPVGSLI